MNHSCNVGDGSSPPPQETPSDNNAVDPQPISVEVAPTITSSNSEMVLFVEFPEALECIHRLSSSEADVQDHSDKNRALQRLREIFDKYLELPSLLDRNLSELIGALADPATKILTQQQEQEISNDESFSFTFSYILSALYAISKVRGRKRVQKFLPHEVQFVEPALNALIRMDQSEQEEKANNKETTSLKDDNSKSGGTPDQELPPSWESTYSLWNWIGKLSLVPFDASVVADTQVISNLIELAKKHLSHAGPTREVAASSLASWLSRPDLEATELPAFIEWSRQRLSLDQQERQLFLTMGILQTAVNILKVSTSERTTLLDNMLPLWDPLVSITEERPSNLLMRKYLVKWWTRLGRLYLPPRIAPWRYSRGRRSLKENLSKTTNDESKHLEDSNNQSKTSKHQQEVFYVPDEVEVAMGHVIDSLADSATNVRWSAAKGVGRLTERLPAICAEDVLDAILERFKDREQDHAWHGACLALAELIRRGLLLPHRLPDVVPLVVQAIQVREIHSYLTVLCACLFDIFCWIMLTGFLSTLHTVRRTKKNDKCRS